ncbi:MAG: FliH/SctL family protein [Oscillospiraceae bacterium]|nr:FliH/SctL family protein [Oscillospiraceae bacterium]
MFRIDRSLVKVSRHKPQIFDTEKTDSPPGDDAHEELPHDSDTESEHIGDETQDALPHEPSPVTDEVVEILAQEKLNEYMMIAELEMQEKAQALIDDARVQAAQIELAAREDAEEARKEGWQEGYTEGAAEGKLSFDDKLKECEETLEEKLKTDDRQLKSVLEELYAEQERISAETEAEIVRLSLEVVKKIIGPAEEELGTVFTSLVKNTLRQMSTEGKIIIRIGPKEYERFFSSGVANIELDNGIVVTATVMKDLNMDENELIIDSDEGTVNASIDLQLEYVKIAFERANQYEPD